MAVRPLPEEPQARREVTVARRRDTPGGQGPPGRPGQPRQPGREHPVRLVRPGTPARRRGWRRRWWIEVLIVLVGYQIYEWTRGVAPSHPGEAHRNGLAIWRAEQWLHLAPEPWMNHALEAVRPLAVLAGYYYLSLNFFVPIGMLVWLYLRRPADYGPLRWVLGIITLISLVCFWLLPVSPPRFVVGGLVDTVATSHLIGAAYQGEIAPHANLYAAMPSLHVAWAGWCALVALRACRRTWVRMLICAYPVVTTLDILATANHYLADAVAGAAALGISYLMVALADGHRFRFTRRDPAAVRKR